MTEVHNNVLRDEIGRETINKPGSGWEQAHTEGDGGSSAI
jgi:hypothetical protein